MSPDPLGMGAADLTNPQSLNQYSYVGNNPTNVSDPNGMDWGWGGFGGIGSDCVWCEQGPSLGGSLPPNWRDGIIYNLHDVNGNQIGDANGEPGPCTWWGDVTGPCSDSYWNSVTGKWQPNMPDPTPDQQKLQALKTAGFEASHDLGCVAIPGAGLTGGGAAYKLGQPVAGSKPFITPDSSIGTSPASEMLRDAFPQKLPFKIPTPVGGLGTGSRFRIPSTTGVGTAAGRYVPFAGALLAGYSMYQMNQCLDSKP